MERKKQSKQFHYQHPNHFQNLADFQVGGKLCDFKIQTVDRCFHIHKIVLAMAIPFFEKMFCNDFQENVDGEVTLHGISSTNLKYFIDFAYSGSLTIDKNIVQTIWIDADFLGLKDLVEKIAGFLESYITKENVYEVRRLALMLSRKVLEKKADRFLLLKFMWFQTTDDYLELPFDYLKNMISDNELQVSSESDVFKAIINWTENDVLERKKYLPELLGSMKISCLSLEFLTNNVLKNELIASSNVCLDVIQSAIKSQMVSKEKILSRRDLLERENQKILIFPIKDTSVMEMYDPLTGCWKQLHANRKVYAYVTTAVLNNRLYMLRSGNGHPPSLKVFESSKNRWKEISIIKYHRVADELVALNNDLYVCGNFYEDNLNSVTRYCPDTNEWTSVAPMISQRRCFRAIGCQGFIYIFGGCDRMDFDFKGPSIKSIERYDPVANKWSTLDVGLNEGRIEFGLANLNDKIYICGGTNDEGEITNTVEIYDPEFNTCEFVRSMNCRRRNPLVVAFMGKLWAIGGNYYDGMFTSVEIYDPATDLWTNGMPYNSTERWVYGGVISIC